MIINSSTGRVLGLAVCVSLALFCSQLNAAGRSASSKHAEVAVEYKSNGSTEFRLADYEEELLQCSALSAIHMWIGDNIGEDSGSEVRKAIDENYWLNISKGYLSLAEEVSANENMSQQAGVYMRSLAAEWRRLTETEYNAEAWGGWYDLIDRCETWRPEKSSRSYYSKGRQNIADQRKVPTPSAAIAGTNTK